MKTVNDELLEIILKMLFETHKQMIDIKNEIILLKLKIDEKGGL